MHVWKQKALLFSSLWLILAVIILPVYGEVESIQSDKLFYTKKDTIHFSGTVDKGTKGLVTIVIRDSNNEFVLLSQAAINADDTFAKKVEINEKFETHGIYKAIAFIQNMTAGATTQFDFSLDGSPVFPSVSTTQEVESKNESTNSGDGTLQGSNLVLQSNTQSDTQIKPRTISFVDPTQDPQYYLNRYYNEPKFKEWFDTYYPDLTIEEAVGLSLQSETVENKVTFIFPDPTKDPQHYIDRYNNEPNYKEWFDRNFPGKTIYEVVGLPEPEISEQIITKDTTATEGIDTLESSSMLVESIGGSSNSFELSQGILALGGIGALLAVVYSIKRKMSNNVRTMAIRRFQETENSETSQIKNWHPKFPKLKQESPTNLVKERLAKGEITVDEYYKVMQALKIN